MSIERSRDSENLGFHLVERLLCPERCPENWQIVEGLAELHPEAARQLWLLIDYQNFKTDIISWGIGVAAVREVVKAVKGVVRYPPDRRQILGKMRELKMRHFLQFYQSGIDPRSIASYEPIETLLYGDVDRPYIEPIKGRKVKVRAQIWQDMVEASKRPDYPLDIPSPFELYSDDDPEIDEEIPF